MKVRHLLRPRRMIISLTKTTMVNKLLLSVCNQSYLETIQAKFHYWELQMLQVRITMYFALLFASATAQTIISRTLRK